METTKYLKCNKIGVIQAEYTYEGKKIIGIFNVEGKIGDYSINLKDGVYRDLIEEVDIQIINGEMKLRRLPVIFEFR